MEYIKFVNFSVYYRLKNNYAIALNNVSLSVAEGELAVVVGPSGCGKTTLLKSIFGETGGASKGILRLHGRDIDNINIAKEQIAYVSQNYSLTPTMTVYDNIAYPLRMLRVDPAEIDRRVRSIAKDLGIYPLLTRKPRQLSGGQHQRAAIARALIKKPRLILMDEPFAHLDPTIRKNMRELLKKVHSRTGCTILFVTHDLPEAFALADRIIVMRDGEIEECGSPKQLEECHNSELLKEFFGR